jgi:NAD-dependent DNA ligase
MDTLVANLEKANDNYRNGLPLLMTDEEYDAALDLLAKTSPSHSLLKTTRGAITNKNGTVVKMPYYLGSLDKAKTPEELAKWCKKVKDTTFIVSEKLDGISGLFNPCLKRLYLSGDDNTGLDVSAWIPYIKKGPAVLDSDIADDIWFRGELIMPKSAVPPGRLGRSIVNGIFHHAAPDPIEAAKVHFVAYEVIGQDASLTMKQQFAWINLWGLWTPWSTFTDSLDPAALTTLLADRRAKSEYDMDGLVIRTNHPLPRVTKGNPKDAVAWKPPNGESKLAKVVNVEWNASSTGKLIPRVEIEPTHLGGSTIQYVSGVNARRVVDWKIGPGATVILRKGGDVIPVIDSVEVAATVVFPPQDTWEWDGDSPLTAVNIRQKKADATTIAAQFMKMVQRLGWENIGPSQMRSVVDAGYTTVPLLRKVSEEALKKLLGPVKGAHLYKTVQKEGWEKATELDLFVASPLCPSGIGKTRLEMLQASEPDLTKWSGKGLVAPKGWSPDALKEFQAIWVAYEAFRRGEWSFLAYPYGLARAQAQQQQQQQKQPIETKGSVVFSGFRDSELEATLEGKGYKVLDAVRSDCKALFIPDKEDPLIYTSTKVEKAKKVSGCRVLRRADWSSI